MILLSILIPTRNRKEELEHLLRSIDLCQVKDAIEIIVADNGSDDTAHMIKRMKTKMEITYFHNDGDIGYDRSFIEMVKIAKGQYLWLVGDDDEMICRNVRSFVHLLKGSPEMSIIQVNFVDCDKDLRQTTGDYVLFDYVYKTFEQEPQAFLEESKGRYGFAGAIIYNRQALLSTMDRVEIIPGFHFISTMLYILIRSTLPVMIYGQPLINRRTKNESWCDSGRLYIFNLINRKYLSKYLNSPYYSKSFIDSWKKTNQYQLFESIIAGRYRQIQHGDKNLIYSVIKGVYRERFVRIVSWILLYVPTPHWFLSLIRSVKRNIL